MKRGKKLLIMAAALAAVVIAYILVVNLTPKDTGDAESDSQTVIWTMNADVVHSIEWDQEEELLKFEKNGENWSYADDAEFPADDTKLSALADTLTEVTSSKTISSPKDLSEYGLDEPWKNVTLVIDNSNSESESSDESDTQKTITFSFGDTTQLTGEVYCSIGDGNVYLVDASLPESFESGLYDVVTTESIPEVNKVLSAAVENSSGQMKLENHEGEGLAYSDEYSWFENTGDSLITLDTEFTENYLSAVTGMLLDSCVDYKADEQTLADYGLDTPAADIELNYTAVSQEEDAESEESEDSTESEDSAESFHIQLGTGTDGNYYVRFADSSMVYSLDAETFQTLTETSYYELQPDEVLAIDWDNVSQIDISLDGESYTLTKELREIITEEETSEAAEELEQEESEEGTASESESVENETAQESETEETEYETVWTMNGEDLAIESAIAEIKNMTASGYANDISPEHDIEISFRIYREDAAEKELELSFYGYDSTSCLVQLNGVSTIFVPRENVVDLVEFVKTSILY